MGSVGDWPESSYAYQYPQHYRRYRPSQRPRPPPFNNVLLERARPCPSGTGTYFNPTRPPGFDLHSGDDSDLDLSDEALSQVLEEEDDGVGDGGRGGGAGPNLAATSTEKLRQAKDLWDLRWSRWWGYNWSRKRDEAVRKQRVQMSRSDRADRRTPDTSATTVHSRNKSDSSRRHPDTDPAQAGPCSSDDGNPTTSGESDGNRSVQRRVWRRLQRLCKSSTARIHALRARIADKRRALFKKNEKREENLIDFDTSPNSKPPVPLIPEYLTEVEPEKRKSVHNVATREMDGGRTADRDESSSRRSEKRLSASATSLASLERLAVRLQQLQRMDDVSEVPLSRGPERSAINVSRGTSPISIFSAKQNREPSSRVQQAYRLMVEKTAGVPSTQSSPTDTIKTFARSDYHFNPASVRLPQRTMVFNQQRDLFTSHPCTKEPPQYRGKSTPVAPTRASVHNSGGKHDEAAYMLEQHRLFSQATSEVLPEQHRLLPHSKQATSSVPAGPHDKQRASQALPEQDHVSTHKPATNEVLPKQNNLYPHNKQTNSEGVPDETHPFYHNKWRASEILPKQNHLCPPHKQGTSEVMPDENHPISYNKQGSSKVLPDENYPFSYNTQQATSKILPEQIRFFPENKPTTSDTLPELHYPFTNNHQAAGKQHRNNQATDSEDPSDEFPPSNALNPKENDLKRDFHDFLTSLQRERESCKLDRPFIPSRPPLRSYGLYKPRVIPSYTGAPLLSPLLRGRAFPPLSLMGSAAAPFSFSHFPSMCYSFPFLAPWLTADASALDSDGYAFPQQKLRPETSDKQFRSISSQTDEETFTLINRRSQKSVTDVEVTKTKSSRTASTQTEDVSPPPKVSLPLLVALEEAVTCCHQTTSTHFSESCGTQTNMNEYSPKLSSRSNSESSLKRPKMVCQWLEGRERPSAARRDLSPESWAHSPCSSSSRSRPLIREAHLPAVPEKRAFDFLSPGSDRSLSLSNMADFSKASMVAMKSSRGIEVKGYLDDVMTSRGARTNEEHLLFIDYESLPEIKSSEDLASVEQCEFTKKDEQATQTTKRSRKQKIKLFFQRKLSNLSSASE